MEQFVIRNCTALFAVDHRILVRVCEKAGAHVPAFPGDPDRPAVILHQSLLVRLASGDQEAFGELQLSSRQWASRKMTVKLPGKLIDRLTPVEFPLYTLGKVSELSSVCADYDSELVCA
ncbi:MAG: hypothetical protein WD200_04955 [Candidatus Andersenbacteria bacterium]